MNLDNATLHRQLFACCALLAMAFARPAWAQIPQHLNGNGSSWTNAGDLRVGDNGLGTLSLSSKGVIQADSVQMGSGPASIGNITVSAGDTLLSAAGPLTVGQQGSANLSIIARGSLTTSSAMIASESGSNGVATVSGAGSTLDVSGALYVGGSDAAVGGTGSLVVTAGATAHVGGALKIWSGGSVTATTGTLSFDLDQLQMSGGTLTVPALNLTGHSLAGCGSIRANVSGSGGITADAGDLTIGNADSFTGFIATGPLTFGTHTLTLQSKGFIALGQLTTLEGGTLAAPNGLGLPTAHNVVGFGSLQARVATAVGSTIEATGNLSLGVDSVFDGFVGDGVLVTNNYAVTILDRDFARLGALTTLGNADGPGTLNV